MFSRRSPFYCLRRHGPFLVCVLHPPSSTDPRSLPKSKPTTSSALYIAIHTRGPAICPGSLVAVTAHPIVCCPPRHIMTSAKCHTHLSLSSHFSFQRYPPSASFCTFCRSIQLLEGGLQLLDLFPMNFVLLKPVLSCVITSFMCIENSPSWLPSISSSAGKKELAWNSFFL